MQWIQHCTAGVFGLHKGLQQQLSHGGVGVKDLINCQKREAWRVVYPPDTVASLRPIANLVNLNKIQEKAIAEMVIENMEKASRSITIWKQKERLNQSLFSEATSQDLSSSRQQLRRSDNRSPLFLCWLAPCLITTAPQIRNTVIYQGWSSSFTYPPPSKLLSRQRTQSKMEESNQGVYQEEEQRGRPLVTWSSSN